MRPRRPVRAWLFAALGVGTLVLGGYAVFRIATRETAEPASVADAVERFRARPAAGRALPAPLRGRAPTPGVYVYATHGFEQSRALGTRRHPYPSRTTIAVTATSRGCLRSRWSVLATRGDAVLACPRLDGGLRLATQSESHEFAGHRDRRTYVCTPHSTYLPAKLAVGTSWTSRCAIEGTTTQDRGVVLGSRAVTLDGRRTRTVLLRTTTRVSGETTGTGTGFTWILPRTRLIVRRTIADASSTDTIVGAVPYVEHATLMLSSPRPQR